MRKKEWYYICSSEDPDFPTYSDDMGQFDETELKKMNIRFTENIPCGWVSYAIDIKDSEVLKYKNLTTLIEEFIFASDDPNFTTHDILLDYIYTFIIGGDDGDTDDDYSYIGDRSYDITSPYDRYFILRHDKKTGRFNIIPDDTILKIITQLLERYILSSKTYLEILSENYIKERSKNSITLAEFFTKLEKQTDKNSSLLSILTDKFYSSMIYGFEPDLTKFPDMTKRESGYYYEHGHSTLFETMFYELKSKKYPVVVVQRVKRADENNNQTGVSELYAFTVSMDNDENVSYEQLTAQEVYESFTKDHRDGSPIKPSENDIYRGAEPDDIICGFDMV